MRVVHFNSGMLASTGENLAGGHHSGIRALDKSSHNLRARPDRRIHARDCHRLIDAGAHVEALCASRLGACGASEVDVAELSAAFAASEVVAAFERGARFDTSDEFNSGATPAVIEPADDNCFVSGRQCVAPCTPIPPGVVTLLALPRGLEAEQRASGPRQGT